MHSFKTLSVAIFMVGLIQFINSEEYTLNTPIGALTGLVENVADEYTVTQFFGIPFAEPPVGDLRFEKPVPKPTPLASPFMATQMREDCAQFSLDNLTERAEDCLYLNVYVPYNMSANGNQGNKRPVMVWIYGGGFVQGGSFYYDGSLLSTFGDVIIVTLNYRLAFFGFLTSGDDVLPGNMGLWDQHLAIKWVHDNIESFGGDAGRVTIFGESAGSASVVYQTFYPGNLGLFQRAIAQSGSSSSFWANRDRQAASRNVAFIAEKFGCTQSNTVDIIECLRQVPAEQFDSPELGYTVPEFIVPVVDDDFVLDTPAVLMAGESTATDAYTMFNSVDLMIGYTSADGLGDIYGLMEAIGITDINEFRITKEQYEDFLIPQYLAYLAGQTTVNKAVILATANEYTDWTDPYSETKRYKQLIDFPTDLFFAVPALETANLHLSNNAGAKSTYVYEFAVRPLNHLVPVPPVLDGSDVMNHADDIFFVFGEDIEDVMADEKYSYLLPTYNYTMTLWTNFAKTGNPNSPRDVSNLINSTWPDYSNEKSYIRLTTNMSSESVKTRPRERRVNFWNNIVPSLIDYPVQEISREDKTVTVTTQVGDIIGVESYVPWSEDYGFRVASYRGIPYAKAPVGNLRFQRPVAKEPFTTPFNATQFGPACIQKASTTTPKSEDCLLLNVFVPTSMVSQESEKAVMIWIHGGGYISGESNSFDPRVLVGYGDVIVVTINYRVHYFGFMTTGDNVIPGNRAMWDQHTAIKWVHDNIGAFGGDTNRITVFGVSAGASAVGLQLFYPGNRGLFQRAIGQSGTMGNPGSIDDMPTALRYTRDFAELAECPYGNSTALLECLQSKPISVLQNAIDNTGPLGPYPTRDNIFILDHPDNYLSGTSSAQAAVDMFNSIDYMTGFTNGDGLVLSGQWLAALRQFNPNTLTLSRSDYENVLMPFLVNVFAGQDTSGLSKRAVVHEYTDWSDPDSEDKRAQKLVDMYTDAMFAVPAIRVSDLHMMSNRSTYLYKFSVRPLVHSNPVPPLFDGPNVMRHADDVQFVMGTDITALSDSEVYHQLFRVYQATMSMWSNFAKTGNPNTPNDVTKFLYTTWPQYDSSRQYLEITQEVTQNAAKQGPHLQALNFWTSLLPETSSISQRLDSCTTSGAGQIRLGGTAVFAAIFFLKVVFGYLL